MGSIVRRFIAFFPLFCTITLSAQELSMEDIIAMSKLPVEQIDSIVRSKDFAKTKEEIDSASTIIKYTSLTRTDTSLIQRTFTIGQKKDNSVELQYAVYQKADALTLLYWLERNGFKLIKTSMPAQDGKPIFEYTVYKRKKQAVGYEEKEFDSLDKKEKRYIFTVSSADFP